jgi:hypothetical protein
MYQGFITQKHADNQDTWITDVRGDVRARYVIEIDNTFTLCLPVKRFREWALDRDIHGDHINQWAKDNNITIKQVRLAPKTDAVSCFLIPGMQPNGDDKTK